MAKFTTRFMTATALALVLAAGQASASSGDNPDAPIYTYDIPGAVQMKHYPANYPITVQRRQDDFYFCPTEAVRGGDCKMSVNLRSGVTVETWLTSSQFVEVAEGLAPKVRPVVRVLDDGAVILQYVLKRGVSSYTLVVKPSDIQVF